ncbi:uncharacterized protein [Temnothorax nylanderi]|uniref:uncharacterized protein n=1 Tax=Temnothorax nylanderi TaxID=102681 RepID=UPI003A8563B2
MKKQKIENYFVQEKEAEDMQQAETPIVTSNFMEVDHDVNDNVSEDSTPSTSFKLPMLPFILQGEFFKVTTQSTEQKIIAQCTNCPKVISGSRTSTGNFASHYNRLHPHLTEKIKLKRLANKKTIKTDTQQNIVTVLQKKLPITAKHVHDLILTYIIEEMRPLHTIYKPSFRNLICGLIGCNKPDIPGKNTLRTEINNLHETKKIKLKELLEKQAYICLTTDIWSCRNKSYIGMTTHFITDTFERKSYMLACKRILYNHTYKNIALVMHHILTEFNIDVSKVTHVVTDNATNFGKTFRCFGVTQLENPNQTRFTVEEESEDSINENSDIEVDNFEKIRRNLYSTTHENDNSLTDELGNEIILPPHLTCCSHTLNLIVTTDCKKILDQQNNSTLKKIYRSTFAKLNAFWNLLSRSTVASDICSKECECKFPVPVIARWNSQYDAVKKILAYKNKLNVVFEKLKLQKLKPNEIEFLEEFIMVIVGEPRRVNGDLLERDRLTYRRIPCTLLSISTIYKPLI